MNVAKYRKLLIQSPAMELRSILNAMNGGYEAITSFQKGQASRIFKEVNEQDKVLIVSKQNKPQNVVISYERYKRLREEGADI